MRNPSIRSGITAFLAAVAMALFASSAFAVLKISVMPNGTSATPLPNAWDSRPYTWPGNNLELFGRVNAYDGGKTLTWTWSFGAGEIPASATGTATTAAQRDNIAASHVYPATGSKIATLTVTDVPAGGTETASAAVFIDVVGDTPTVRKNLAIQRALKYLYMTRQSATVNGCSAHYWATTDTTGDTGLAVLAFEDYNHRASNNPDKDIYADTVDKGLKYIEHLLRRTGAANTPNSDSDLNGNGYKMYETNNNAYRQGIVAMAIANTREPGRVSTCGYAGHSLGMSYQTILEDMVDYIAYMQEERTGCSGRGGWRYGPNYCSSDNSVSQWPVLGLAAASQAPWNISAPAWMIGLMPIWSNYSQNAGGAFGYTYSGEWLNVAKTGSGIIQQKYSGISGAPLTNAINYIGNNWCATASDYGNLGDHYAMYAAKKGLQYAGITDLTVPVACRAAGTVNWQSEYDNWYVTNKVDNGTNGYYWPASARIGAGRTTAAFALLVMAKGLAESPPIADAGPAQEVPANTAVAFDGSGSYHSDPTKMIVGYEWDFDYNGINFDVDAVGPTPTKAAGYAPPPPPASTKIYTVALRVTDNNVPPLTGNNTTTVTVSNGNQAPVANAGGPYGGPVGANITLNGTGSSDANRAGGPNPIANPLTPSGFDEIVLYEWDLDGDGLFGAADGEPVGPSPVVNFGSFIGTKTISLKVTDSFGASGVQSSSATTIAFSDVRPLCYVPTQNVYNPITRKWTKAWKLKLQNTGTGDASAISATLTSVPLGVTVLDGNLAWGGILPAGGTLLSTDTFSYRHGSPAPDIAAMTWNIELTDNFGVQHVILNIPQGSGICAP